MKSPTLTSTAAGQPRAAKYLTFRLQQETYGIPVLQVREIIRLTDRITAVPQLPGYVRGVINLRGKVIPIIDLRRKFELEGITDTEQTCIIVVQARNAVYGVVVDGVEEVVSIAAGDIEPAPDFGAQLKLDYVLGMARTRTSVKTLLDIDKVVAAETLERVAAQAAADE